MKKIVLILTLIYQLFAGDTMNIYDIEAQTIDGKTVSMSKYKDRVILVVNVASKCGFTGQYEGLEALHKTYSEQGLSVLGFPSNQFMQQEPGTNEEIKSFCTLTYGVEFDMFAKIDVNGDNAHPLYKFLKSKESGILGTEAIKWNFTKFLVDREGNVFKRYSPSTAPKEIKADIEKLLKG